jgi:hypothetical protein
MGSFVQLRGMLGSNKERVRGFAQLEARLDKKLDEILLAQAQSMMVRHK